MAWYNSENKNSEYVLWSRVKIYRNIEDYEFLRFKDYNKNVSMIDKVSSILERNGFHTAKDCENCDYLKYAEMGYADKGFIESENNKALYINEPCNLSVSIGGGDHICISSMLPSLSFDEANINANEIESLLDMEFNFSYSDKLGYISPYPLHTGHGVVYSSAVYLPVLSGLFEIKKLKKKARILGLEIHPMTTYEYNQGNFFIIEYIPDVNVNLIDAMKVIGDFIKFVVSFEKECESKVFSDNSAVINKAWRSVGIMEYASSITEDEMLSLLSDIRLTHCLGISDTLPYPISYPNINTLQAELMNTFIYSAFAPSERDNNNCDVKRAKALNEFIRGLKIQKGCVV